MDYSAVLSDSFKIFWKHKSIWLFGILLALFGQGDYNFSVRYNESTRFQAGQPLPPGFSEAYARIAANWPRFLIVGLAVITVFWVVSNLVAALARAALVGMVRQAETENVASIRHGLRTGLARFWPLFLISLLLGLPQLLVILFAVYEFASFIQRATTGVRPQSAPGSLLPIVLSVCTFCCIGVLVSIVLYLIKHLAARACVLETLSAGRSILRGWQLLRRNPGWTLLNALVLGVCSGVYGLIAAIPALVLWIPVARALLHRDWTGTTILLGIGFVLYFFFFSVLLGGILTSFNETAWTRLYGEFVKREAGAVQEAAVQAGGVV
jgi:hypothetical protein